MLSAICSKHSTPSFPRLIRTTLAVLLNQPNFVPRLIWRANGGIHEEMAFRRWHRQLQGAFFHSSLISSRRYLRRWEQTARVRRRPRCQKSTSPTTVLPVGSSMQRESRSSSHNLRSHQASELFEPKHRLQHRKALARPPPPRNPALSAPSPRLPHARVASQLGDRMLQTSRGTILTTQLLGDRSSLKTHPSLLALSPKMIASLLHMTRPHAAL
jgi:hypothetical protein